MSQVDVVVPCYNYGRFLNNCVDSVLSQEGVDVRVLVIDDASTDDTPDVGRRLAALDSRVEFHRHEVNQGHIATYNEGLLEWTSAKYSLLLSADDALASGALKRATRLMDRHNDVGMSYGIAVIFSENKDIINFNNDIFISDAYRIISGIKFLQYCCEHTYNLVPTPTVVVRTELQHRLGGYLTSFPHAGDQEMWMRFAAHSTIGIINDVQGYYRWHGKNMSSWYYKKLISDRREFAEVCKYTLLSLGTTFPESGRWLQSILRKLGEEAFWSASAAFDRGNLDEFRAWLAFSREVFPELRYSARWQRLWMKTILGLSFWQWIYPVFNRIRGIREKPFDPQVFRVGERIGGYSG